jgi:hypothetical protein
MSKQLGSSEINKTISNSARFVTYMNHVFFYTRFVFIYVLSALLEIMGLSALASAGVTVFMIVLTIIIVGFVAYYEHYDYSEELESLLTMDSLVYTMKSDQKATPNHLLYLYIGVEYLFDISWMFGASRQIILSYYTQSHAIAFLASYQALIFLGAAYLAAWLAYIRYSDFSVRAKRQNHIFYLLNMHLLKAVVKRQDAEPFQHRWLYSIVALGISFALFVGFQYFLSGGFDITQCYSISYYLLSFLSTISLSYVFLGHKKNYWNCIWVGFMTISASLGLIFFGKVVFMALLGHIVSDFYYSRGVGIFFGCAIAVGFLYGQILEHFAMNQIKVTKIYDHVTADCLNDEGQIIAPEQVKRNIEPFTLPMPMAL